MVQDAYAGLGRLYEASRTPGPIIEAACWAHGRRKFFDLAWLTKAPTAAEAVKRIDVMFAIERDINVLLSRSGCVFARTVAALSSSRCRPLREQRASLSRNSDTAKAINCCLSLRCIGHLAASSMKGAVIFRECRRARTRGNRRAAI